MSHPQLKVDLLKQQKNELNAKNNTLEKNKEQAKKLALLCIILSFCFSIILTLQIGLGMFNDTTGMLSLLAPNTPLKALTISFLIAAFDSIAIQISSEIKRQQYITAEQIAQVEKQIAIQTEQAHKLNEKIKAIPTNTANVNKPTIEQLLQAKEELLAKESEQPVKQNILKKNK